MLVKRDWRRLRAEARRLVRRILQEQAREDGGQD